MLVANINKRGFTDHEHLDAMQLIHMNGRMYDFNNGRFLSVDPFIQGTDSNAINPYSYIQNNPLSGVDPSGYMSECGPFELPFNCGPAGGGTGGAPGSPYPSGCPFCVATSNGGWMGTANPDEEQEKSELGNQSEMEKFGVRDGYGLKGYQDYKESQELNPLSSPLPQMYMTEDGGRVFLGMVGPDGLVYESSDWNGFPQNNGRGLLSGFSVTSYAPNQSLISSSPLFDVTVGAGVKAGQLSIKALLSTSGVNWRGNRSTALPDEYWINRQAADQTTPGIRTVTIPYKPSSAGGTYRSTTHYDEYGRRVGQTHHSTHGRPQNHPNPHHHRRDPITKERIQYQPNNRTWPGLFGYENY